MQCDYRVDAVWKQSACSVNVKWVWSGWHVDGLWMRSGCDMVAELVKCAHYTVNALVKAERMQCEFEVDDVV